MVRELYKAIAQQISQLEKIRHIDLWNRNVEFLEEDGAFPMPAVFIEFGQVDWKPLTGYDTVSVGDGTVNIHIVQEWNGSAAEGSYQQEDLLDLFDLAKDIQDVLNGLEGRDFHNLRLASTIVNHDHEDIIDNIDVYRVRVERKFE